MTLYPVILPVGPEFDHVVLNHWRKMWIENLPNDTEALQDDFDSITQNFLDGARAKLDYQTFLAFDPKAQKEDRIIGSVSCQRWISGDIGLIDLEVLNKQEKLGSVWAVYVKPEYRKRGVAQQMMEYVKAHWRKIGCQKGLLLYASETGQRVYSRVGFRSGELLLVDLPQTQSEPSSLDEVVPAGIVDTRITDGKITDDSPLKGCEFKTVSLEDLNDTELSFLYLSYRNGGTLDDGNTMCSTNPLSYEAFTQHIRSQASISSQAFFLGVKPINLTKLAISDKEEPMEPFAGVICKMWKGPLPLVLKESLFKIGTLSHLSFINPSTQNPLLKPCLEVLLKACLNFWKANGCLRGCLLTKPTSGVQPTLLEICTELGFDPSNGMVIDLYNKEEQLMIQAGYQPYLLTALPQQVKAAFPTDLDFQMKVNEWQKSLGTYIDPENNWFTQNLSRLGSGFNLQTLQSSGQLAQKFDRLASNYSDWTVGNQSEVERWISQQARIYYLQLSGKETMILDAACGIGLMSQQLRLHGYQGKIIGADISPKMLERALVRANLSGRAVLDLNQGLGPLSVQQFDLVICTGAMELLNFSILKEFWQILKPDGMLWISFQARDLGSTEPTKHQGISGLSWNEVIINLKANGFELNNLELCPRAFYTPYEGQLCPVPYYFVNCIRGNLGSP